jgi:hypothetical protein
MYALKRLLIWNGGITQGMGKWHAQSLAIRSNALQLTGCFRMTENIPRGFELQLFLSAG